MMMIQMIMLGLMVTVVDGDIGGVGSQREVHFVAAFERSPSFGGRDTCILISITSQLLFFRYCSNAIMAGNGLASNIHSMGSYP